MAQRKHREHNEDQGESKGQVVPINKKDQEAVKEKVRHAIERLEEANNQVDAARTNKAIVMKEAVDMGLDRKILNKIVKLRKMGDSEKESEAEMTKLYAEAVGLQLSFDI